MGEREKILFAIDILAELGSDLKDLHVLKMDNNELGKAVGVAEALSVVVDQAERLKDSLIFRDF